MNILVARAADDQGFAMADSHRFDPGCFFWSSISFEVFQYSNMVDLNVCV